MLSLLVCDRCSPSARSRSASTATTSSRSPGVTTTATPGEAPGEWVGAGAEALLRFHDLRHSFGTQAIRAFNIYEVQRMMGHRHITTTERYLHYAPDPDAAAKLSGLWGGPAGEDGANVVSIRRGEPMGSLGDPGGSHAAAVRV
jgi:Phage integrase family